MVVQGDRTSDRHSMLSYSLLRVLLFTVLIGMSLSQAPMEQRQKAIEEARQRIASGDSIDTLEHSRFYFSDGYLKYQLGDVEAGIKALKTGQELISFDSHPQFFFRMRSLMAGIMTSFGEFEESVTSKPGPSTPPLIACRRQSRHWRTADQAIGA